MVLWIQNTASVDAVSKLEKIGITFSLVIEDVKGDQALVKYELVSN